MLDQAVSEMKEDLVKMRQASAEVFSTQKMLQTKYTQAQASAVCSAPLGVFANCLCLSSVTKDATSLLLSCHNVARPLLLPDGHVHCLLKYDEPSVFCLS